MAEWTRPITNTWANPVTYADKNLVDEITAHLQQVCYSETNRNLLLDGSH